MEKFSVLNRGVVKLSIHKKDVIRHLENIALYMELKGDNPFRISAYRKAASALENDERSLAQIAEFTSIPNIGKGTASIINEYIETNKTTVFEQLQKEVPEGLIDLLQIQGLGGKKIATLHKELGIENLADLKHACEQNQVQTVRGFGKKTEENILKSLVNINKNGERVPLPIALSLAEEIESFVANFTHVDDFSRAGSLRRLNETVRDLDFVISTDNPPAIKEQLLELPNISEVVASGESKVTLKFQSDYEVSVDFRIVAPKQYATTLHHFTGSKQHNVRMRQIAKQRGEKINEYGVEVKDSDKILTFSTEKQFFNHFNLPYIPPEIREDGSELDLITDETSYLSINDIKSDLHLHTTWSDGAHSIEEMAEACRNRGYEYIVITDHSKYLKVANGLTVERLRRQREEINRLNENYDDFHIFSGVEMDILPDGTLDFPDDFLQELDFVIASIHSSFTQPEEKIMKRLEAALTNKYVNMIAHPTGRLVGRRDGYDVNIDLLIKLAKETGTILELNANPHRLDLSVEHLKKVAEAGVKIAINTDAHQIGTLNHMEIGVAVANKARLQGSSIVNTMSLQDFKQFLQKKRR